MNVSPIIFVKHNSYCIRKLYFIIEVITKHGSIIHVTPFWMCNGTCYGDYVHVMTEYHSIRAQSSPRVLVSYVYNYYVIHSVILTIFVITVKIRRNYRFCAFPKMHCSSYRIVELDQGLRID